MGIVDEIYKKIFKVNEQENRKLKSIEILKKEKIPYNKNLPVIESEKEIILRNKSELCERAICLAFVSSKLNGMNTKMLITKSKEYEIYDSFTKEEKMIISLNEFNKDIKDSIRIRCESLWVLLWALGFVEILEKPEKSCDLEKATSIIDSRGKDKFIFKSKMREKSEILDQLDLNFRYHWAITDSRLNNRSTSLNLRPEIVYERHFILNWIIRKSEWENLNK